MKQSKQKMKAPKVCAKAKSLGRPAAAAPDATAGAVDPRRGKQKRLDEVGQGQLSPPLPRSPTDSEAGYVARDSSGRLQAQCVSVIVSPTSRKTGAKSGMEWAGSNGGSDASFSDARVRVPSNTAGSAASWCERASAPDAFSPSAQGRCSNEECSRGLQSPTAHAVASAVPHRGRPQPQVVKLSGRRAVFPLSRAKQRVLYALENLAPEDLQKILILQASHSDASAKFLALALPKTLCSDPGSRVKCLRCCKSFDERYNGATACRLPHEDHGCLGVEPACVRCGLRLHALPNVFAAGDCYVGPHSSNPADFEDLEDHDDFDYASLLNSPITSGSTLE